MSRYYQWLVNTVCDKYHAKYYSKLLKDLYEREFTWTITRDEDRAIDGMSLRREFVDEHPKLELNVPEMSDPCSILEMMVALSTRIELEYMRDPRSDVDNTGEWFWNMIMSLGLDKNDDNHYDFDLTDAVLSAFVERRYRKDGKGGIFYVENIGNKDMIEVDIWTQMQWFVAEL